MKMHRYLTMSALVALMGIASSSVLAQGEPMYKFLPSVTVVDNVKTLLQNHGVDVTAIEINADSQGVVQLSGQVSSKEQVDTVTNLAKQAEGVYAVLGKLRYRTGEVVPAPVPEAMGPVMDTPPAPGTAVEQSDAQ